MMGLAVLVLCVWCMWVIARSIVQFLMLGIPALFIVMWAMGMIYISTMGVFILLGIIVLVLRYAE